MRSIGNVRQPARGMAGSIRQQEGRCEGEEVCQAPCPAEWGADGKTARESLASHSTR
jgi:hypothetical protein